VGCGVGDLAAAARGRGWQVTAIEPAPAAVRRARERGIEVVAGEAADALAGPAAPGPFDLVVFRDSLAHMSAAGSALAGAVRRLVPGGWLAARVPNRHPGVLRAARWAARVTDASGVLHLPAQVLHLDAASLAAALDRQGLEQVAVTGVSEGVAGSGGRYSRRALPDLAWRLLVRRWRRRGWAEALWGWGRRP
jgi:SAM-dependent methyltransferase